MVIDSGGTLTKVIATSQKEHNLRKYESSAFDLSEILEEYANVDACVITGGRSQRMNINLDMDLHVVNELEALANFMRFEQKKEGLITSIGTGTPFLLVSNDEYHHIGGTGLGGGTILGLSKKILGISNFRELDELALTGKKSNINLTVGDIVGSGIGMIPADATASNFAKETTIPADLAMGIFSLVAENIAVMLALANRKLSEKIVLTGSTLLSHSFQNILIRTLKMYGIDVIIPKNPEFAVAYGALLTYTKTV